MASSLDTPSSPREVIVCAHDLRRGEVQARWFVVHFLRRSPIFIITIVSLGLSFFFLLFSLFASFSLSTSIFRYSFSRLFSSSRVSDAVSCLVCGRPSSRWFFKWFAIQTPRISRRFIAFYLVVHHDRNRDTHSSFQVYTL